MDLKFEDKIVLKHVKNRELKVQVDSICHVRNYNHLIPSFGEKINCQGRASATIE